jgi:hypothetical protein
VSGLNEQGTEHLPDACGHFYCVLEIVEVLLHRKDRIDIRRVEDTHPGEGLAQEFIGMLLLIQRQTEVML